MTSRKLDFIDIRKITAIDDVLSNLRQLDSRLSELGLDQFKLFNKAYQVVTRSIQQAIKENYFNNPEFIEKFIVSFAGCYFKVTNDIVNKNHNVPMPWSKLNEYATNKSLPVFISLMLGANAHISYDLPQVLKKLMQKESTEELLKDVFKIDRLLMKSGREIIGLFEESNKILNFLKCRFQFMYYRPVMYKILGWRISAWKSYRKLKKDHTSVANIETRSTRIANRLLRLSAVLR